MPNSTRTDGYGQNISAWLTRYRLLLLIIFMFMIVGLHLSPGYYHDTQLDINKDLKNNSNEKSEGHSNLLSSQFPILFPITATITSPGMNISLPARPAMFGPLVPRKANNHCDELGGFTGSLSVVKSLGCNVDKDYEDLREKIALVSRGGCGFYEKVLVLQEWGAVAVIVGDNTKRRGLVTMFTKDEIDLARIPSVFVSNESYELLKDIDIVTITTGSEGAPIADTMIILLISPLCSLSIIYALLLFHRRYKIMKERAPKSFVDGLPTRTWTKQGQQPDKTCTDGSSDGKPEKVWVSAGECIICLEDYISGVSKVMKLPCGHEFHLECISKWLVSRKKTCPICKQDVTRLNETTPLIKRFRLHSEEERGGTSRNANSSDNEPLLLQQPQEDVEDDRSIDEL